MKRTLRVLAVFVIALALISASGLRNEALAKKEKPPKNAPAPAAGAKPEAAKAGDDKPFDEVVKDMTVSKGLFTFYRRADDNKVLIEILPAQLDKTFLFSGTLDQAVGERGFYGAQQIGEFPLLFHQIGKNVQLVLRNT